MMFYRVYLFQHSFALQAITFLLWICKVATYFFIQHSDLLGNWDLDNYFFVFFVVFLFFPFMDLGLYVKILYSNTDRKSDVNI